MTTSKPGTRLEWLQDRVTQMGHPPQMYDQWHAEIEKTRSGQKHLTSREKSANRRAAAFRAAGIQGEELPPGMVYAHGLVISEAHARIIGDQMVALGELKPPSGRRAYYAIAAQYAKALRQLSSPITEADQ
jgi:hypothetical protein